MWIAFGFREHALPHRTVQASQKDTEHFLLFQQNRRDQWRLAAEDLSEEPEGAASQPEGGRWVAEDKFPSSPSVATQLFPSVCIPSSFPAAADQIPESVLGCLPSVRVRSGSPLLHEGQQCRLCLQSFAQGQRLRTLPCKHKVRLLTVHDLALS